MNIRKRAALDRAKSKTVLGKKKPDKITFEKYRKLQLNLQNQQHLLEEDDNDNDDPTDDVNAEREQEANNPNSEDFPCEECTKSFDTMRGLKLHKTRFCFLKK